VQPDDRQLLPQLPPAHRPRRTPARLVVVGHRGLLPTEAVAPDSDHEHLHRPSDRARRSDSSKNSTGTCRCPPGSTPLSRAAAHRGLPSCWPSTPRGGPRCRRGSTARARWRGSPGHQLARALQDALATVGIRRRALGYRITGKRLAGTAVAARLVGRRGHGPILHPDQDHPLTTRGREPGQSPCASRLRGDRAVRVAAAGR